MVRFIHMHCSQIFFYKFCYEPDVTITNEKARESQPNNGV